MPIDINSYVLSNASGLKLNASNSKIMAASYGVLDPLLPAMCGAVTSGGTFKVFPYPINDANQLNVGSAWSTSTFRFTAPVTGRYYTSFSAICGDGSGAGRGGYYGIIVNGALWYFGYRDSNSLWELVHMEMVLNLSASDYVQWACNIAPAPDSTTVGGAYTSNHNTCAIWLVG